jgi:heavy metal sensor kinase
MPSPPPLSRRWNSLRVRLTLWNTTVVLIAVMVALLAVREGLRFYLIAELDAVLDDEVKVLILAIEKFHPDRAQVIDGMQRMAEGHSERGWHVRWMDPDHATTIWASAAAPATPLSQAVTTLSDRRVWASDTHRSVERRVDHPRIPRYYIRVGAPTQFIDDDVARLTRILAPVGLGLLLLAPLGGYLLAERAIDPLQKIIATTARLRPSRLDERLLVRGVGDELDQLAVQINHFLDQIAEHLRRQRDFVANAAHELRSPLTAIQASVEVTLDKPRSTGEYEDLLVSINDECQHLGHLVNQLLQLLNTEEAQAALPRQAVPLSDIVRHSLEMFGPIAEDRGVALRSETDGEVTVQGHPQQLRQLITNLIDNALKFTPAGGAITVRLSRPDSGHARLCVEDTGIGIPRDELPRIFERFYQVDKSRSRAGDNRGNGLGLSICQVIAQLHGGAIDVDSELGRGSTFRVTLPV